MYDLSYAALVAVRGADILPAFRQVDTDCVRLIDSMPCHAWPSGGRNVLALRAREAGAKIAELGEDIWPPEGLLEDAVLAFAAAAIIVRALAKTCKYEAALIDHAYEIARITRDAPRVTETLTAAGAALTKADEPLVAAGKAAGKLARRDAALPPLILGPRRG